MEKINFEETMEKLEEEVRMLESGKMTLDEALESFEKSIKLVKLCNEKLDSAQRRVRILTEGFDGTVTDAPFETNSDEI